MDLGQCNSKRRSQIQKGLSECEVRKVDAQAVARDGYAVRCSRPSASIQQGI